MASIARRFRLTAQNYTAEENHTGACVGEFGPRFRVADWTYDLSHVPERELATWCDSLNIPVSQDGLCFYVNKDGEAGYKGWPGYDDLRYYFFERQQGLVPSSWKVDAKRSELTLGSWFGTHYQVLCVDTGLARAGYGWCVAQGTDVKTECAAAYKSIGVDQVDRDFACGWPGTLQSKCLDADACKAACTWDPGCRGVAVARGTSQRECKYWNKPMCVIYSGCANVSALGHLPLRDAVEHWEGQLEPMECVAMQRPGHCPPLGGGAHPHPSGASGHASYIGLAIGLACAAALACCLFLPRKRVRSRLFRPVLKAANKASDPSWAAISLDQLMGLQEKAAAHFGESYGSRTMHDVVAGIVRPECALHDKCYAHIVNGEDLLHVTVFISHCWAENFDMFCEAIFETFRQWPVKPNLWICAFALFQTTDPSKIALQVGTGKDPRNAPFSRALKSAEKVLIVRNDVVDLYSRIWCCWELFCACEFGLVDRPGVLMVAGPMSRAETFSAVDIAQAGASNPEDKRAILSSVENSGVSFREINKRLTEVKFFDASAARPRKRGDSTGSESASSSSVSDSENESLESVQV